MPTVPLHIIALSGISLQRSCAYYRNCCEFIREVSLLCVSENSVLDSRIKCFRQNGHWVLAWELKSLGPQSPGNNSKQKSVNKNYASQGTEYTHTNYHFEWGHMLLINSEETLFVVYLSGV